MALEDDLDVPLDVAHLTYGKPDVPELQRLFTELEFTRMLDQWSVATPVTRDFATVTTPAALAAALHGGEADAPNLAIDLELTRPEAMRAAIVGVALSTGAGAGVYVPLSHRYLGAPPQLSWREVKEALGPVLADPEVQKEGHDLKHTESCSRATASTVAGPAHGHDARELPARPGGDNDARGVAERELGRDARLVRRARGGAAAPRPRGRRRSSTSSRSRRPTPFAAAQGRDGRCCWPPASRRGSTARGWRRCFRDVEMPLSRVLRRDGRDGGPRRHRRSSPVIGKRVEEELQELEARAKELAGRDFSVRSRDQLETILFDELELPVLKRTPKGGRSTDA